MDTHPEMPAVRVHQGETIKLRDNERKVHEISCNDIARLALAMYDHSDFFSHRRGLRPQFTRDFNGSGRQRLSIKRKCEEIESLSLIEVTFAYTYGDEFLYEEDLIMDQGKDYEPTVNKGKHRFAAETATIRVEWDGSETQQWRSDAELLSRSTDTLTNWLKGDLEMIVRCGSCGIRRSPVILSKDELKRHAAAELTLENLEARLKCRKCGRRRARVAAL